MDKNFYNEASAKKLGWEPSWFGEKYFDDKLVRAIKNGRKATIWALMVFVVRLRSEDCGQSANLT